MLSAIHPPVNVRSKAVRPGAEAGERRGKDPLDHHSTRRSSSASAVGFSFPSVVELLACAFSFPPSNSEIVEIEVRFFSVLTACHSRNLY